MAIVWVRQRAFHAREHGKPFTALGLERRLLPKRPGEASLLELRGDWEKLGRFLAENNIPHFTTNPQGGED